MYGGYENNPSSVLICPYNNQHKIARSKFPTHLIKCEANYPSNYLEICPFSASHRFPKAEIEKHVSSCPMKRIVDLALHESSVCSNIYGGSRANMELRTTIDLIEYWSEDEDDSGFGSVSSNSPTVKDANKLNVSKSDEDSYNKPLRAPHGYGQVRLMDEDDEDDEDDDNDDDDDNFSPKSYMGMGRGKPLLSRNEILKSFSRGRGKMLNLP